VTAATVRPADPMTCRPRASAGPAGRLRPLRPLLGGRRSWRGGRHPHVPRLLAPGHLRGVPHTAGRVADAAAPAGRRRGGRDPPAALRRSLRAGDCLHRPRRRGPAARASFDAHDELDPRICAPCSGPTGLGNRSVIAPVAARLADDRQQRVPFAIPGHMLAASRALGDSWSVTLGTSRCALPRMVTSRGPPSSSVYRSSSCDRATLIWRSWNRSGNSRRS
jgi:hypothetical protein